MQVRQKRVREREREHSIVGGEGRDRKRERERVRKRERGRQTDRLRVIWRGRSQCGQETALYRGRGTQKEWQTDRRADSERRHTLRMI